MYNKDAEQLLKACEAGNAPLVQEILGRTKNIINLSNENGETAIYIASRRGHLSVVTALLEAGANPKLPANNGKSPLDVSANAQVTMILTKGLQGASSSGLKTGSNSAKVVPMEIGANDELHDKFDANKLQVNPSSKNLVPPKLDSSKSFFSSPSTSDRKGVPNLTRRNSISSKARPNFQFSEALEKAENEVQEEHDSLEDMRIKLKKFLTNSPYGQAFENVIMAINILSTLEVIYSTYLYPNNEWDNSNQFILRRLDLAFGAIFALVWTLGFLTADRKIPYIFSLSSMVDITTVIPIFATYNYNEKPLYKMGTVEDVVFYTMFLLKNTRILRSLQLTHKLVGIKDAVDRYIGEIAINISVMILFFSGVMQFLEKTQQPLPYHTWMYYIWVTIATVGYGDITPKTDTGRFAAMAMIGFAIISVPKMTNTLIEKMNLQSVYARAVYQAKSRSSRHIIICGDLVSTSLEDFFEELFHEDHENDDLNAVLLIPQPPSVEILLMLRDPKYNFCVSCLQGSALVDADLKRASAETAVAIFIMTNKFSTNPDEEDAKSILQNLSIKRYLSYARYARGDTLFCMQLIRPENLRQLTTSQSTSNSSNNAPTDESNVVVCLNEIKMGVLARAVVYPGANTFIMNLITSSSDNPDDEDDGPDEKEVAIKDAAGKPATATSNSWLKEYQKGCDWEIYTTSLSDIFIGAKFSDLSLALYEKLGVVLFALQLTELKKKKCKSKLLLNPADLLIPPKDEYKVEAFVLAKNKATSDLSFSGKSMHDTAFQAVAGGIATVANAIKSTVTADSETRRKTLIGTNVLNQEAQDILKDKDTPPSGSKKEGSKKVSKWNVLKRSSLLDKKVQSSGYQEILQRLEDEHFQKVYYLRPQPAELADVIIKSSLLEEIPYINNHIIVIGKELSNLYDLIKPLRAKYLGNIKYIVILYPHDIPFDVWQRISIFDCIHVVRGSPLEELNLRRAGIFRAQQVVVLAEGSTHREVGNEALVDSDAIFAYQCVKRMNPSTQIVIEIVNQSNIGYLVTDIHASANTSDYKLSNQFAAGTLFTTSLLDSLVCQAYYNPHIIKVVNLMISGVDQVERSGLSDLAMKESMEQMGEKAQNSDDDEEELFNYDGAGNRIPKLNEIKGSCLYQIAMPDNYVKKTYGRLYQHLALQGIIPMGLLRGTLAGLNIGPKSNKMPYVYTNPDMNTELYQCDRIFVLALTPQVTMGKTSVKDWLLDIQMQKSQQLAAASGTTVGKTIPGTIPAGIESLQNSQKKLEEKMGKLQSDMNRKFNSIVSLLKAVITHMPNTESLDIDDIVDEAMGGASGGNEGKLAKQGSFGKDINGKDRLRKFSVDSSKSINTTITATSGGSDSARSKEEPSPPEESSGKELTFREKIKMQAKKNRMEAALAERDKMRDDDKTAASAGGEKKDKPASPNNTPAKVAETPPTSILRKHSVDMAPPMGSPGVNATDAGFTPAVTGKKRYSFSEPVVSTVTVIQADDSEHSEYTEDKETNSDTEALLNKVRATNGTDVAPEKPSAAANSAAAAAAAAAVAVAEEKKRAASSEFKPSEIFDEDEGHLADKESDAKPTRNNGSGGGLRKRLNSSNVISAEKPPATAAPSIAAVAKYAPSSESESEGVKLFEVKRRPAEAKTYEQHTLGSALEDDKGSYSSEGSQPLVGRRPATAGQNARSPPTSGREQQPQRPTTAGPTASHIVTAASSGGQYNANASSGTVGVLTGPPLAAIMRNSPRRPPHKTYASVNTDSEGEN